MTDMTNYLMVYNRSDADQKVAVQDTVALSSWDRKFVGLDVSVELTDWQYRIYHVVKDAPRQAFRETI